MLKDDRMMTMLTFVVFMIAVGTMGHRTDALGQLFGAISNELVLQSDGVIARANTPSSIDVLANDLGVRDGDAKKLVITKQPKCGHAIVRDGQAQYMPLESCTGSQVFRYSVYGRGDGQAAEVIVAIRMSDPAPSGVAAKVLRDIAILIPAEPLASAPLAMATPSVLAVGAATVGLSAAIQPPAVPRPKPPVIAGLADPISVAAIASVPMQAVIYVDSSGLAPGMTAPVAGLAEVAAIAVAPFVPQPDHEPHREASNPTIQASWAPTSMAPTQAVPASPRPL